MRVFVQSGKRDKDRWTILSADCLYTLRNYWRRSHPDNAQGWLFPNAKRDGCISVRSVQYAFARAIEKAGIRKHVTVHSLRHAFASHLLEDGVNLFQIKALLGHSSIASTAIYVHIANVTDDIVSPADAILARRG
jgi:site-specific recombinase XerD